VANPRDKNPKFDTDGGGCSFFFCGLCGAPAQPQQAHRTAGALSWSPASLQSRICCLVNLAGAGIAYERNIWGVANYLIPSATKVAQNLFGCKPFGKREQSDKHL